MTPMKRTRPSALMLLLAAGTAWPASAAGADGYAFEPVRPTEVQVVGTKEK